VEPPQHRVQLALAVRAAGLEVVCDVLEDDSPLGLRDGDRAQPTVFVEECPKDLSGFRGLAPLVGVLLEPLQELRLLDPPIAADAVSRDVSRLELPLDDLMVQPQELGDLACGVEDNLGHVRILTDFYVHALM
jgi:hypothetical protein